MSKKRMVVFVSALGLVLVLVFSMMPVFLALGQPEPAEPAAEASETPQPADAEPAAPPELQRIDYYYITCLRSQDGNAEIYVYNGVSGFIGALLFCPDGDPLPADYVDAGDRVFLFYHFSYFDESLHILENRYPVYLRYDSTYHGLYVVLESVGAPETFVKLCFDFGTESSPVEEGFIRVTDKTLWSYALGYGWYGPSGLSSRDRGAPDDLRRDLVQSGTDNYFYVALPKGRYQIAYLIGDKNYNHDEINIDVEGTTVFSGLETSAGYFYDTIRFSGQEGTYLIFYFSDGGGSDGNWVINAITITSAD